MLGNVIAEQCIPKWRDVVLARKQIFIEVQGRANGYDFNVLNWGIWEPEAVA
jgi:hypothetical protein